MKRCYLAAKNRLLCNRGMSVVEVVLITVVLIGLVIIFQSNIRAIVEKIFKTMSQNVQQIK